MYNTGTGFAFVPHHTITTTSSSSTTTPAGQEVANKTPLQPSQEDVHHALDASDDEGGEQNNQSEQRQDETNGTKAEGKVEGKTEATTQLQLSEMITDEAGAGAGAERAFHVTVAPGADNPELGKYICFVNYKDSHIQ
eukprot:CAMPEP_0114429222 /NCGR_PEP_ID=MMETSP0103-20121206/9361_1 /TAXON_ID=37642 ORGANISM="Paraphysomonas imperforata, Strain PA2" /NCGR_SAMPLE_ID=MMETSP0103 /ASSEMBLY_ACC=CAM_ASM_000201 /LENGTH=137 /DNA_ID=CAMNT_0001598525 /DNA_START=248 /DNA_END=661 /DNA_ORIENTATION=+